LRDAVSPRRTRRGRQPLPRLVLEIAQQAGEEASQNRNAEHEAESRGNRCRTQGAAEMRPPGRLARRGTVDMAQDWGRSSTFAPYLLLTLVSQVHPVSLAIPTPRRCLTCAATVLRVTSRDHDPAELHRRFEEIITGMDLDDLKELAGQLLTFPSRVPAKSETRPSLRKPGRGEAAILRVRVDLAHAKPPIW